MYLNRNTKARLITMIAMYLAAGMLNLLDYWSGYSLPVRMGGIASALFFFVAVMAAVQMQENIVNRRAKFYLLVTIVILILWQALWVAEQTAIPRHSAWERYAIYLYYFATPFIPNFLYIASRHFSLREDEKAVPNMYWTFGVSGLAFLLTMTNDLHQLVFRFPDGLENFDENTVLNVGYFVIMAWVLVLVWLIASNLSKKVKVERIKKARWVIVASFFIVVLYLVWFIAQNTGKAFASWFSHAYQDPSIWMGIALLSIELAIRMGIIKSNYNYRQFYQATTISASIVDSRGEIRYQSADLMPTSYQQRAQAVDGEIYLDDNHRLRGKRIPGGFSYWVEDLSHINTTLKELESVKEILEEDNDMVKSENDMIAREASAEEQMKLYTMLEKNVMPQINEVDRLIHLAPPKTEAFKVNLALACVYKAYIKRFSNLILLGHERGALNIYELESSIRESMEYLKLNGVKTRLDFSGEGDYPVDRITLIYAMFQALMEENLGVLTHVSVDIEAKDDRIICSMRASGRDAHAPVNAMESFKEVLEEVGGSLKLTRGNIACLIEAEIPKGGVELSGNGPLWRFN